MGPFAPDKAAIIGNDDMLSYRDFAHAIDSAIAFLQEKDFKQHRPPSFSRAFSLMLGFS